MLGTTVLGVAFVEAHLEAKQEVPWQRVWRLPPDVFCSHRQHVTGARVECTTCYGDMYSRAAPPPPSLVPAGPSRTA